MRAIFTAIGIAVVGLILIIAVGYRSMLSSRLPVETVQSETDTEQGYIQARDDVLGKMKFDQSDFKNLLAEFFQKPEMIFDELWTKRMATSATRLVQIGQQLMHLNPPPSMSTQHKLLMDYEVDQLECASLILAALQDHNGGSIYDAKDVCARAAEKFKNYRRMTATEPLE